MAIYTRPDGKFDVRVTKVIGKEIVERRKRGLNTKGEARRVEEELKAELVTLKQKGWSTLITWEKSLEEYYRISEKKDAYSTYKTKKSVLETHTSDWKERPIDSFGRIEIERRIETALREVASKKKILDYIRGVFRRQIELGVLTENPCRGISFGKIQEKALIAMTRDEIVLLLSEAKKQNHPWYPVWRVVYELGLRSGEGLALHWADVNFETGRVLVNKAYCSKSKQIGPTKSRKPRIVAINFQLMDCLKELKSDSDGSAFVLPQFSEWMRGEAAKTLRAFQVELNIRETNFHSLRASFITHLLLKGVPVTKVQSMVGHADLKTTQKYVRLVGSDIDGATDALGIDLEDDED